MGSFMSIIINSLSYVHPDKEVLFEQLNLSIARADKAALVGNNGAGKSTLLQIIAGQLSASGGELNVAEKPWFVPQHLGQYDAFSIAQTLGVDKKLHAFRAIAAGDADPLLFDQLEDDWEIEDKVNDALNEWDIGHLSPAQLMQELSGGEKTKVFLAGIMIWQPSVILLDEPTNHLDAASRAKLYAYILSSRATILMVSHDRHLLNLINKTIELSAFGLEVFGGNYDFYAEQKHGKLHALQSQLEEQSKSLKQTQQKARDLAEQRQKQEARGKAQGQSNSLPRIIAGGLKIKAEQSTAKILDKQQEKTSGIADQIQQIRSRIQQHLVLKIDIAASDMHHGKVLVEAEKMSFSYSDKALWKPLSFQLRSGDRLFISGNNGAGKSTLINLITGVMEPSEGTIKRNPFRYLYLDQDYSSLRPDLTVVEQLSFDNTRQLEEHQLKSLLIYSQFPKASWERKTEDLSGGEKMKLSLCCLAVSNNTPDLLILDEPTNNLDIKSLEILTEAVKSYHGTLVIISHDQHFIADIGIDREINLS